MVGRAKINRPLSPHLTIYKPQFTSVLSIMHRITGIGLGVSVLLVIIWFCALALGAKTFELVNFLFDTTITRLILILSVWALWYHTCAGIRHLIWDFGYGLEVKWITPSAYLVLVGSLILTILNLFWGWFL